MIWRMKAKDSVIQNNVLLSDLDATVEIVAQDLPGSLYTMTGYLGVGFHQQTHIKIDYQEKQRLIRL